MRFQIQTLVQQSCPKVFSGFNRTLFLKLSPLFPPIRLLRFDGCMENDVVILELDFIFFKQVWESHVTAQKESPEEIYFIDEGRKLPFFLSYWKHRHRIVRKDEHSSYIVDDITFKSPFLLLDYLLYPQLYLQFYMRKPVYKKIFS